MFFRLYLLTISVLWGSVSTRAATQRELKDYDLDHTSFYLVTAGVGKGVEQRFGHTIFLIVDSKNDYRHHLNWGTFDFDQPNFYVNFLLGKLRYWVTDYSFSRTMVGYQWEKRAVVAEKIHLTKNQKKIILEKVLVNLKPENRYFMYDFFFKNCSTIPRDLIDDALGGRLKRKLSLRKASKTFRQYVRDHLNIPSIVPLIFDVWGNEKMDAPISAWEEMFYPIKLRQYLKGSQAFDDQGNELMGQPLLGPTKKIIKGQMHLEPRSDRFWPFFFVIILFLQIINFLVLHFSKRLSVVQFKFFTKWVYLQTVIFSLISFLLGSVMLFAWGISEHQIMHHNLNMLIFWPVDIIFVGLGLYCLLARAPIGRGTRLDMLLKNLGLVHIVLFVALGVLSFTGLITQNVSSVLFYGGLPYMLNLGSLLYLIYKIDKTPLQKAI